MTRRLMLAAFATLAVFPLQVLAHEGHDHKVLGTVTMAAADHVMLKDKDNKDSPSTSRARRRCLRTRNQ
jgi:hypothetical protein